MIEPLTDERYEEVKGLLIDMVTNAEEVIRRHRGQRTHADLCSSAQGTGVG